MHACRAYFFDDLGREFKRASVDLKRLWGKANPPATRAEAGAQKGKEKASTPVVEAFSRGQRDRYRALAQVPALVEAVAP